MRWDGQTDTEGPSAAELPRSRARSPSSCRSGRGRPRRRKASSGGARSARCRTGLVQSRAAASLRAVRVDSVHIWPGRSRARGTLRLATQLSIPLQNAVVKVRRRGTARRWSVAASHCARGTGTSRNASASKHGSAPLQKFRRCNRQARAMVAVESLHPEQVTPAPQRSSVGLSRGAEAHAERSRTAENRQLGTSHLQEFCTTVTVSTRTRIVRGGNGNSSVSVPMV